MSVVDAILKEGTKFGIRIADSDYESGKKKILAISIFPEGNVPVEFTELTLEEYERVKGFHDEKFPFVYWDTSADDIAWDETAQNAANAAATLGAMRNRLKELYFEIEFTTELTESTTALQNEYDALLIDYNDLKSS